MSYPAWLLRAGYGRLILWRVDASGDPVTASGTVDTASVRPLGYAPSEEVRTLGDGTTEVVTRVTSIAPEVVGWDKIQTLRAWQAAGYRVRGVVLARGRGRHILWNQSVPVRLLPFSDGRHTLEGDRLTLETHLRAPAVTEDPDLLAFAEVADDVATAVLPAPGLRVYAWLPDGTSIDPAAEQTIDALDSAGEVLATTSGYLPTLVLPDDTWSVRRTGAGVLTAYQPLSGYGSGGYLYTPGP